MKTVGSQLKKLEDGILKLTKQITVLDCEDEVDETLYKDLNRRLSALNEILDYVNSYKWLSHNNVIERLKFVRKCGFDYSLVKKELDISEDAMKSFMKRVNQNLDLKIGDNTIKKIMNGNISDGLMTFRILSGTYKFSDCMIPEVFDLLPEKKFSTYSLKECMNEIEFIYTFSKVSYTDWLEDLDVDKLAFIRYILESETEKYAEDQRYLMFALKDSKKVSYEKLIKYIDDKLEVSVE